MSGFLKGISSPWFRINVSPVGHGGGAIRREGRARLVPYIEQPFLRVGPVTLYAFGTLVAASVVAGALLLERRCRSRGLDPKVGADLVFYLVVPGFLAAHLYAVLAYFPREVLRDPILLLKVWENISSFGGFAGGLCGFWLFFRRRGRELPSETRWRFADAVAFVFPFSWVLGRLGCTFAHDHPGAVTTFPLSVSLSTAPARAFIASAYEAAGRLHELPPPSRLAGMGFHDLGFYEFLYTLLVIAPAFLLLDRKPRQPGFYPVAFLLLYVPARFALDFLRISDARYLGLTPAQYAGLPAFALATWGILSLRVRGSAAGSRPRQGSPPGQSRSREPR